jgi:DNA-binding NarL/FixJ family response regulator
VGAGRASMGLAGSLVVTISVLLINNHRLVREALRNLLAKEPGIEVVGEAHDIDTAIERTRKLAPEVLVFDIGLHGLNEIETARKLMQLNGVEARIVALLTQADRRFVVELTRAGAIAHVSKSSAGAELVRAIRAAAAGQSYVCPEVAGSLMESVRDGPRPRLSRREREVLRLIAEGVRSPAIAERLKITVGTVEVHRRNIMGKVGLRTIAELTRYAVREGLIAP